MNVKITTAAIFVLIILGGLGIFFMNGQNTRRLAERISPTVTTATPSISFPDSVTVVSADQRVSFRYPQTWELKETTVPGGRGQFGPILQSWVLQSFPPDAAGQGGIPGNTAKIDIEIQQGGADLPIESLVDCGMKTTSCEKIGIDNEQFIRSEATLNTGMKAITVATFYDDKILRLSALIAPGSRQADLGKTVDTIFRSITFSETPQS